MKKLTFLLTAALPATALVAATVDSVTCRQNWPWSTDITVTYTVSGVESGTVDASFAAFRGDTALTMDVTAITGERYGLGNGTYTAKINPLKAFGTERSACANFKVKVSLAAAPENRTEALYKIFDLDTGSCTDVTRADLMNDKYGAYETRYAENIGRSLRDSSAFSTTLDDVMIWTGVTNDVAYKTTKMVMRKIDAANKVWQSGDPKDTYADSPCGLKTQYWNMLTYDYYIAVFETTKAQYIKITGKNPPAGWSGVGYYSQEPGDTDNVSPVNLVSAYDVIGYPSSAANTQQRGIVTSERLCFPTNSYLRDVGTDCIAGKMWKKTGVEFTLPTLAEWEYACMGGNTTPLYSGCWQGYTLDVCQLAWSSYNSNGSVHKVGGLKPNAYGLYDMLGNVVEDVLGVGELNEGGSTAGTGATQDDPVVDPVGTRVTSQQNPFACGGCWGGVLSNYATLNNQRHASRHRGWCEGYNYRNDFGFRFVIPARSDGQWADHPAK